MSNGIWSVVGYTILRFVVAWGAFGDHGANVWIFGLLDVGTAWPYAKAIALVTKRSAAAEWRRVPLPALVALVSFFAPYAYLWFAAGSMPDGLRAGLAIFVVVLAAAAVGGVIAGTRKMRRENNATGDAGEQQGTATGDVVIDLRAGEAVVERTAPSGAAASTAD